MVGEESALRVSEIWESEDAWQQNWNGGLKAALATVGVDLPDPERFQVHEIWGSRVTDA
jgi:quinol monooxygenase YgiN